MAVPVVIPWVPNGAIKVSGGTNTAVTNHVVQMVGTEANVIADHGVTIGNPTLDNATAAGIHKVSNRRNP